jgi:hypothetical protein
MGHAFCLQPRVTLGSPASSVCIQNSELWGDLEDFLDGAFYLDVSGLGTGAVQPMLSLETSPSQDPGLFVTLYTWTFGRVFVAGVQQVYLPPPQALFRYVRWVLAFTDASYITFQIWATLRPAPR